MASPLRALASLFLPLALLCFSFQDREHREAPCPPVHTVPIPDLADPPFWMRREPALTSAWPDEPRLQIDAAYRPVVCGRLLLIASSRSDSVTALELDTGAERWRFFAEGPVRFAPVVWEDRVFFVSDDGHIYCLAADGQLLWKFRGGPSDRKILGNGRLISTWPARGAPAVADGTVYFAAGIWPFMGVFIHALDARTGQVIWSNSGDGSLYINQPHYADAFGGIAPQGTLAVAGDRLLVPNGRAAPACYDRRTGKLLHYKLAENSRLAGGATLTAAGSVYLSSGALFEVETGDYLAEVGEPALLSSDTVCGFAGGQLTIYDLRSLHGKSTDSLDRRGRRHSRWSSYDLPKKATVPLPAVDALAQDEQRLYVASGSEVFALDGSWKRHIDGKAAHLAAADGKVIVSTHEGRLYCFATDPNRSPTRQQRRGRDRALAGASDSDDRAAEILRRTGVREGYCVVWGVGAGGLLRALARQNALHIIAIEPDAARVNAIRQALVAEDIPAERISLLTADWRTVELPPYLASLMVVVDWPCADERDEDAFLAKLHSSLRPYGGVACLANPTEHRPALPSRIAGLANATLRDEDGWIFLTRPGPLPGAGDWTHEHADAANTRVSRDRIVQAPLGLLWFGGSSHAGTLPRHGHGPMPQVIDGRAIIEGVDMVRAMDIYTGRLLWETRLAGVGTAFDSTWHQAGANGSAGNFASTSDGIYIGHGTSCIRLDPATGKQLGVFRLPVPGKEEETLVWNHVRISDDLLIAAAGIPAATSRAWEGPAASSKYLAVLDRHSGAVRWTTTAQSGFRHNAICVGAGRLYATDRPTSDYDSYRRRYGEEEPQAGARLTAFDLRTGKELWSTSAEVFGTWLSYSARHDVLVEAGRLARDTLYDEPRGMRAFRAASGAVLWHRPEYSGPAMIHGDTILKEGSACDLLTGQPKMRCDPLTGAEVEWGWMRGYGCNTPAASEHLLTFRSGAAGYFDLLHDGGTGNFGGFRSGCTNNLIVAGGVLCAPEYTRTCTCGYPNQTSLALVPMPEAEQWTYFGRSEVKGLVRRVGINLGAPGSRKADDGTLWLEYPASGAPSPGLSIASLPEKPECFRQHATQVVGDGPKWIGASGARGLTELTVTLASEPAPERCYSVRLHFLEPDAVLPGQRLFDVALQGETVLSSFDVCAAADGPNRRVVREFRGVKVSRDLTVTLRPLDCAGAGQPLLSGVEIVAEGW
jgi:outer membrane protein assembly factor BamB